MRARLVLAGTAALLVGGTALATTASATAQVPPIPLVTVTVTHNDGGTQVGTGLPGQPLASVSSDNRGICYGFSYQMGHCVPIRPN